MFWTVRQAAHALGVKEHQVYYLLAMGCIEAVKVGKLWRIVPAAAKNCRIGKKG
jgi:excisionase family DNA binding protein